MTLCLGGKGVIGGFFEDSGRAYHGYVRRLNGTIKVFDPPGSVCTIPMGHDSSRADSGAATGYFSDRGKLQGFVRTP